jgi:DNA repair protein RAD7
VQNSGYVSDQLDEPQESPPSKKQKRGQASKKGTKGKKKKDEEDEDEEDPYNALSRSLWANQSSKPKPPVGSFENCGSCEKKFTVVSGLYFDQALMIC